MIIIDLLIYSLFIFSVVFVTGCIAEFMPARIMDKLIAWFMGCDDRKENK